MFLWRTAAIMITSGTNACSSVNVPVHWVLLSYLLLFWRISAAVLGVERAMAILRSSRKLSLTTHFFEAAEVWRKNTPGEST